MSHPSLGSHVLKQLRAVFTPEPRRKDLFECRHCGTVVCEEAAHCHACGSQEIARYTL